MICISAYSIRSRQIFSTGLFISNKLLVYWCITSWSCMYSTHSFYHLAICDDRYMIWYENLAQKIQSRLEFLYLEEALLEAMCCERYKNNSKDEIRKSLWLVRITFSFSRPCFLKFHQECSMQVISQHQSELFARTQTFVMQRFCQLT